MTDIKPCPHCGNHPRVYHGTYLSKYGDSVQCACDAFDLDDELTWHYTEWELAVQRWNEYATRKGGKP